MSILSYLSLFAEFKSDPNTNRTTRQSTFIPSTLRISNKLTEHLTEDIQNDFKFKVASYTHATRYSTVCFKQQTQLSSDFTEIRRMQNNADERPGFYGCNDFISRDKPRKEYAQKGMVGRAMAQAVS
jgi:hypothetical protein